MDDKNDLERTGVIYCKHLRSSYRPTWTAKPWLVKDEEMTQNRERQPARSTTCRINMDGGSSGAKVAMFCDYLTSTGLTLIANSVLVNEGWWYMKGEVQTVEKSLTWTVGKVLEPQACTCTSYRIHWDTLLHTRVHSTIFFYSEEVMELAVSF